MIAYKLVRLLKSGEITPLFINKKQRLPIGVWLDAENHPTEGYKVRPYWHCTSEMKAPHLSTVGRVWVEVEIDDFKEFDRPAHQGGLWYLANKMKINKIYRRLYREYETSNIDSSGETWISDGDLEDMLKNQPGV